ncbi:MAG: GntR family transcriptional regulator [Clostridia bacterium]|nr:GntR family transcriptional regulator [Clostridia bacterium]MDO5302468.1 GntR family transcriptional regulator [Clostridia bacterium]
MINFDLQNHMPLRELVYEELKKQILTGKIAPGTRMMEVDLAEEMGVSRTPIREAIRKLEKEGLVIIEPRRGAYASSLSVKDMVDTLEVRENLEGFAAALAAERMSDDQINELLHLADDYADAVNANDPIRVLNMDEVFHNYIYKCSENDTLIKLGELVQERAQRFRYLYYDKLGRYQNMPLEHREIATSIASRNAQKAKELSEGHARRLKEFIIRAEDLISKI